MVIRQNNINQFANFTKNFPKQMEKAGISINEVLAKSYQRRIRARAKGRLKQIAVVPKGKYLIDIEYPNPETAKIAEMVNAGKYPKHAIPRQLMEASRSGKATVGKKSRSVVGDLPAGEITWVRPRQSTAKGFLTKSMETLQQNTPNLIEKKLQETFSGM